MEKEYLKYIPELFKDHRINAVALTTIPALLYCAAAYAALYVKGIPLIYSIVISCFFAILEYIVRVPINFYSSYEAKFSNTTMQFIWVILTMALSYASDVFFPKDIN